jgi:hypothetical protein
VAQMVKNVRVIPLKGWPYNGGRKTFLLPSSILLMVYVYGRFKKMELKSEVN